jgi:hypothetical protein
MLLVGLDTGRMGLGYGILARNLEDGNRMVRWVFGSCLRYDSFLDARIRMAQL